MPKCEHCGKPLAFSLDATFVEACSVQSIDYPKITLVPIYRAGLNRARERDHKFVKKKRECLINSSLAIITSWRLADEPS
jgi:hypothetical protein